jgi:hypothetical protein
MNSEHFLNDQFPLLEQTLLIPALKNAYKTVDELIKSEPFLQVPSALFNHGRLKSWASDFYIEKLLKTGYLPYEYSWENFDKPTGKFLQIHLPSSKLIISQVALPKKPPRHANFRSNAAFNNQLFLFPDMENEKKLGEPTFLLVHGHQDLSFVHIGLPHPNQESYLFQTANLLRVPHVVNAEKALIEAVNFEPVVTLKEEIARRLRENNV